MSKTIVSNHLLLFLSMLIPISLFSQNKIDEIQIKRSNHYYWGQAYNADSSHARLSARDDLMFKISNEISNSGPLNAKTDLMVKSIRYLSKTVEDLNKVISYVSKTDVSNIIEGKVPLNVHEIKYTEANNTLNAENSTESAHQLIDKKNEEPKKEQVAKEDAKSSSKVKLLIDRLIDCNTGDELHTLLKSEESMNHLVYSWDSSVYQKRVSSENFYIVLIDPATNNIIAFLDKPMWGQKDLKNSQRVINIERNYQNMKQVWIHLL